MPIFMDENSSNLPKKQSLRWLHRPNRFTAPITSHVQMIRRLSRTIHLLGRFLCSRGRDKRLIRCRWSYIKRIGGFCLSPTHVKFVVLVEIGESRVQIYFQLPETNKQLNKVQRAVDTVEYLGACPIYTCVYITLSHIVHHILQIALVKACG